MHAHADAEPAEDGFHVVLQVHNRAMGWDGMGWLLYRGRAVTCLPTFINAWYILKSVQAAYPHTVTGLHSRLASSSLGQSHLRSATCASRHHWSASSGVANATMNASPAHGIIFRV
jgi:hypothetical protein